MSIGKKIKQLRELRNFTQSYMATELGLSLGGYGKIERDETDITLSKLNKIAEILKTDLATILNFDSNQIFHQTNNKVANANGLVQHQQIIADNVTSDILNQFKAEIERLNIKIENLQK